MIPRDAYWHGHYAIVARALLTNDWPELSERVRAGEADLDECVIRAHLDAAPAETSAAERRLAALSARAALADVLTFAQKALDAGRLMTGGDE
jgi:hypothetical protein